MLYKDLNLLSPSESFDANIHVDVTFFLEKDEILIRETDDLIQCCKFVTVVMHKDKEENSHHDSHYRARELAALAAYDHHHLDGEMFLQVNKSNIAHLTKIWLNHLVNKIYN